PTLALVVAMALSSPLVADALAAPRSTAPRVGTPQALSRGVSWTTRDIMAEEARHASEAVAEEEELENEHRMPDRTHLPIDPLALRQASVPPMPLDQLTYHPPKAIGFAPFAPQTLGVNFTAATLSGTNPTSAFPPDDDGAIGPTQYVIAVNGRLVSFNKTTG